MKKLTNDYKLTKIYTSEKEFKKALKSAKNFTKRFMAITQSCSECHTNKIVEDVYFGEETKNAIKKLKEGITKKDTKTVFNSLASIGGTCYKCHNVHEVPAMLKEKFENH
jgi:nitrate/TMAO reductase-like tetraheme cytochrome c subunit